VLAALMNKLLVASLLAWAFFNTGTSICGGCQCARGGSSLP